MKKRLKITEGEAKCVFTSTKNRAVRSDGGLICTLYKPSLYPGQHERYDLELEECKANQELIADAFNTANETQLLPSELKEQRDKLLKRLQSLVLSVAAHPDCTKGSEFDDLSTIGQKLINKIENNE